MSLGDKIEHKTEEVIGQAKEHAGDATDNPRLEGEGLADQDEAHAKQAGDHLKDAGEKIKDIFKG